MIRTNSTASIPIVWPGRKESVDAHAAVKGDLPSASHHSMGLGLLLGRKLGRSEIPDDVSLSGGTSSKGTLARIFTVTNIRTEE